MQNHKKPPKATWPAEFAITVSWGKGIHYFLAYKDTPEAAESAATWVAGELRRRRRNSKKGARPAVHVYQKMRSISVVDEEIG